MSLITATTDSNGVCTMGPMVPQCFWIRPTSSTTT